MKPLRPGPSDTWHRSGRQYVPAARTDIRETLARAREEIKRQQKREQRRTTK